MIAVQCDAIAFTRIFVRWEVRRVGSGHQRPGAQNKASRWPSAI
jgi:hypothetical protein